MGQVVVTILLIVVTWMAFRSLRAFTDRSQDSVQQRQGRGGPKQAHTARNEPIEPMRECPTCHTFRPASRVSACGRADCPYRQ